MNRRIDLECPQIRLEIWGPVARCVIDRSASQNRMTPAMYNAFGRVFEAIASDRSIRALVITGSEKWFITGGDVSDLDAVVTTSPFERLRACRIPVVAAINGLCQASGLLTALLSDISIASDRARFRAPELHVGFPDTWLAAALPAHVGLTRARDLMLTSRWVEAHEAVSMGLVARVVPHDDLESEVDAVVERVLRAAPEATAKWKQAASAHYGTIDQLTFDRGGESVEAREGFQALMAGQSPSWVARVDNV